MWLHNIRTNSSRGSRMTKLRFLLSIAATGALLVGVPAASYAALGERIVPGAPCETVGATGTKGGQTYRCIQKPGSDCPRWAWVYNADVPKSGRTSWSTG